MAISNSDFQNWKADSVTKAFFQACENRIEEAKETLSYSAGSDPAYDKQIVGMIKAYREVLEVNFNEVEGASYGD